MLVAEPVVSLQWTEIAGGGFVAMVLLLALVEYLRRTFATRVDVDRLAVRAEALQAGCQQGRERAGDVLDRLAIVEAEQRRQLDLMAEHVLAPMERVRQKVERLSEVQAAHAATLTFVSKRLERARKRAEP